MVPSLDEIEDLTRFADESFDTDEVDLFEFTGDDESPLTRLKSVILSLDWEISDEILDELVQEVASLRSLWEGDKVAQVYLQGLEKVGNYLRREGAYAHQNAIKLLLTLFYNFEKIISSPDISGETITSLLKSDIRKFKVLQYQISRLKPVAAVDKPVQVEEKEISTAGDDPLANIEATILGLEWEVTDEGLEQFNRQADELHKHLADNKPAEVLLQGLQALGAYISEEKINAHPDSFILLHSFYDGLKTLVTDKDIDPEKRQEILIDRVSSLNNLKEIIAGVVHEAPVDRAVDKVDQILDFGAADEVVEDQPPAELQKPEKEKDAIASVSDDEAGEEKATDTIFAAMETDDEQYPDDILDPDAIQPLSDEIADGFIGEELGLSHDVTPALDQETEEKEELSMEDVGLSKEDLEQELELLFDEDKAGEGESDDLALSLDDEEPGDVTQDLEVALADVDEEVDDALDFGEDLFLADDEDKGAADELDSVTPALAEADEEGGFREEIESAELADEPTAELEDKLDSFFGISEEDEDRESAAAVSSPEPSQDEKEDSVVSALADVDEEYETGFREEDMAAELVDDSGSAIQDKLDSFFGSDEHLETEASTAQESKDVAEEPLEEELDSFFTEEETSETGQEIAETEPALADADETSGFDEQEEVTGLAGSAMEEIGDKLDSFFGKDKEESGAEAPTADTALASLTAVSASLTSSPGADDLKQVADLAAEVKDENIGANQTVLLTLIDSAVALLTKNPEAAAENNTIVQELVAGLEHADDPATLTDTVKRYTSWQQNFFDTIISNQKAAVTAPPSGALEDIDDEIASKVQAGFSRLRETMMKEFDTIRKELKQ